MVTGREGVWDVRGRDWGGAREGKMERGKV